VNLEPFVYRRAFPDPLASSRAKNRRERRELERRVIDALKDSGCTCTPPLLVPDRDGRGGTVLHRTACPLGERLARLAADGRRITLKVNSPECQR
jgi:hypothetical protein